MALRLVSPVGETCSWYGDFRMQLDSQYRLLGVPPPSCVHDVLGTPGLPELLVYFASDRWDASAVPQLEADLRSYAEDAEHLLPVLDDALNATKYLPEHLLRFNAFLRATHGSAWPEALVDEVLTLVWQRRRRRRIFISYRRRESQAIARQLHDRYSQRSFDVFLDERSIEPGVDFQRKLFRDLDDSDAVLLLMSPQLTGSEWVRKEIQRAMTRRIGLLGIIWPGDEPTDAVFSAAAAQMPADRRFLLGPGTAGAPSNERELTNSELVEVDRLLFTGRSQSIASRVRDLIDAAQFELPKEFTVTRWRNDGDLELSRNGVLWLACVVPFRPDPLELWSWWEARRTQTPAPAGIVVVYPQVDGSDPHEIAFRAVCSAWCSSVTPAVELRTVAV